MTEKLLRCGLRSGGFSVQYEDELQSVEIVIHRSADASAKRFDCVHRAAGSAVVTFEDPDLGRAYQDQVFAALKPNMLADARAELVKHGALDGFPERVQFDSEKLFAEALERQCGMQPGSFFVQSQWGLIVRPRSDRQSKVDENKMSCLMAAVMYVAARSEDFKFRFIGNEAFAPDR